MMSLYIIGSMLFFALLSRVLYLILEGQDDETKEVVAKLKNASRSTILAMVFLLAMIWPFYGAWCMLTAIWRILRGGTPTWMLVWSKSSKN